MREEAGTEIMKEEMFEELLESIRQAGAIMRGDLKSSRVFVIEDLSAVAQPD